MNGMVRLIWTYLYRCQESSSTTMTKLESLLKHFFPPNRVTVFPNDDQLEPLVYITHFILTRHPEYGRDLCLELMQEASVKASQNTITIAPERTAIAIEAILLSLHLAEKEEPSPRWPSCADFNVIPPREDYPSSSNLLPASVTSKLSVQHFLERSSTTLSIIAMACANSVGSMSFVDEQWTFPRATIPFEERNNYIIRQHPQGVVAYPVTVAPQVGLLRACIQAWPRCLHPTLPLVEAVDLLIRGVIHVEPSVGEAAAAALHRSMTEPQMALSVVSRFTSFIFNPVRIQRDTTATKLLPEYPQLLDLWVRFVDIWVHQVLSQPKGSLSDNDRSLISSRISDVEAGALFLLSYENWDVHAAGVKIVRILSLLLTHISPEEATSSDDRNPPIRAIDLLNGKGLEKSYLYGYDDLLDNLELSRLEQWRQSTRTDIPLRIADSRNEKDHKIWRFLFPVLTQSAVDRKVIALSSFREAVVAAVSRCLAHISHLAGLSNRGPPSRAQSTGGNGLKESLGLVDQWHSWVRLLCATATLSESRPTLTQIGPEHTRAPSDTNFERERLTTTRGLFRYLTPFLDSEHAVFRDAAVICVSSFPSAAYPQLLEDLGLLAARRFYDESKFRMIHVIEQNPGSQALAIERSRRQERLHSGVAHIYYITAKFLQDQRPSVRQSALDNVIKFVRDTQAFLTTPEMHESFTLQRLRRYFCGTVERLFDGFNTLKDSDRSIPKSMHLSLYRLCEEWCQLGPQSDTVKQRYSSMKKAAAMSSNEPNTEPDALERFVQETNELSHAAIGAMASVCVRSDAFYQAFRDHSNNLCSRRPSIRQKHFRLHQRTGLLPSTPDA